MRRLAVSIASALGLMALAFLVTRSTRSSASMPEAATLEAEGAPVAVRPEDVSAVVPVAADSRPAESRAGAVEPLNEARSAQVVPSGLIGEGFDAPSAEPTALAEPQVGRAQALVTGRVVASNGFPIKGASAALAVPREYGRRSSRGSSGRSASWSMSCDANGEFRLVVPVQQDGEWDLVVEAPRQGTEFVRLGALAGGTTHALGDLVLEPAGSLVVRCQDRGRPCFDSHDRVVVRCLRFPLHREDSSRGSYREVGKVRLTGAGEFTVEDLPAGPVTIEVLRGGRRPQRVGWAYTWVQSDSRTSVEVEPAEPVEGGFWVDVRIDNGLAAWPAEESLRARGKATGERQARFQVGAYFFEGLLDDEVELSVDDPRFEPWSRTIPTDPGHAVATLRGTSRLVVLARDARTREILEHVRTELRPLGTDALQSVSIVGERQGDVMLYHGIPGGGWIPTVRAAGYAPAELAGFEIGPNEEHTLVALLSNGASVAGRVRFPESVPGPLGMAARIELFEADRRTRHRGLSGDSKVRQAFLESLAPRRVARVATALSEPDGTFVLERVLPGDYLVGADLGHGCIGFEALRVGNEDLRSLDVVLPIRRRLTGVLDLPTELDATRFVVTGTGTVGEEVVEVRAVLDRNGRFRSAPLPPGPAAVHLRIEPDPSALVGDALRLPRGTSIELNDVLVPPSSDVHVTFDDFAEQPPARLTVHTEIEGVRDAALVVEALLESDPTAGDGGRLGAAGELDLLLFEGRYRLRVRALDGSWCRWHDELLELAAGAAVERSFTLELARGELAFVDLDGTPLAERELWWWRPGDDEDFGSRGRTDSVGRMVLTLPMGDVYFALPNDDGWTPVSGRDRTVVSWGPSGPTRERLVLGALTDR